MSTPRPIYSQVIGASFVISRAESCMWHLHKTENKLARCSIYFMLTQNSSAIPQDLVD
jgi:hypothetical protein